MSQTTTKPLILGDNPDDIPQISPDSIMIPGNAQPWTCLVLWYHPIVDAFSVAIVFVFAVDAVEAAENAEIKMMQGIADMLASNDQWDGHITYGFGEDDIIPPDTQFVFKGLIEPAIDADQLMEIRHGQENDSEGDEDVDDEELHG